MNAQARERPLCARLVTALGDPWKVELLRHYVPFFSDLPLRSLRELAPLFGTLLAEPSHMLIREGQMGDCVFVLVQVRPKQKRRRAEGTHARRGHTLIE